MDVFDLMVRQLSLSREIATKEILEAQNNFYLRTGVKSLNVFACYCVAMSKTWYSFFLPNPQLLEQSPLLLMTGICFCLRLDRIPGQEHG